MPRHSSTNPQTDIERQLLAFRQRREQRGATIFVVLTVMTLLTAVGVYAARSASLVDRAAGFDRQFLQTHYIAAYGTLALAAELGTGSASMLVRQMDNNPETCLATRGLNYPGGGKAPCMKLTMADLADRVGTFYSGTKLLEQTQTGSPMIPGSLGPYSVLSGAALEGNFSIELSDRGTASRLVPGADASGASSNPLEYVRVTVTALGQVTPYVGNTSCVEGVSAVAGLETMRAYVEFGPVPAH